MNSMVLSSVPSALPNISLHYSKISELNLTTARKVFKMLRTILIIVASVLIGVGAVSTLKYVKSLQESYSQKDTTIANLQTALEKERREHAMTIASNITKTNTLNSKIYSLNSRVCLPTLGKAKYTIGAPVK